MNSLQYTLPKCQRILFFFLLYLAAPGMNDVAVTSLPLPPSLSSTTLARRNVLSLTLSLPLSIPPSSLRVGNYTLRERGPPFLVVVYKAKETNKRCFEWVGNRTEAIEGSQKSRTEMSSLRLRTNTPVLVWVCVCVACRGHSH